MGTVWVEMEEFQDPASFLTSLRSATLHGSRYSPWASQLDRWRARMRRERREAQA